MRIPLSSGDLVAVLGLVALAVGVGGLLSVWAALAVVGAVLMVAGGLLSVGGR